MNVLKLTVAIGAAGLTLLGAKAALAATHGVVFIHGTGDSPGTMVCSGQNCTVAAAYGGSNYWEAGEVASIANGRPYAVVGYDGGTCAPWPQSGDSTYGHTSTGSACPLPTTEGNSDVIVSQIQQFLNTGITEIEIVTHSGGSNQARYILQNYTRNSSYTNVKNATVRVVTIAGTTLGTYLANEVFSGGITSLIGGLVGYGGEGVNLLRTNYMSTYNGASSYFGGINNPVQGKNFYSTGGVSGTTCYGVTIFGACIGIKGPTLGGVIGACDSSLDDAALLALHTLFLNTNDSSTARNSCSDGFISCMGSQRLGNTFSYSEKQDHNQSRRQCNNLDVAVRKTVSGYTGFADFGEVSAQISPHQVDACGFSVYAAVENSKGQTIAWTEGCSKAQLGNGNCDWDCVALYGNDAVVSQWDSTGTKPLAWGASDCTATQAASPYAGTVTSTIPWAENGTYTSSSGTENTKFNGYTCTGTSAQCGGYTPSSYQWFEDPNYTASGTGGNWALSVANCPQSWIGDGTCDECVMALYGADGMDCAPGHIIQCGGIVTASQPYSGSNYYYYNNAIYNEGTPANGGASWLEWQSMPAVANDGVCENTECGVSWIGADGMTSSSGTGSVYAAVAPTGLTSLPTVGTPCTSYAQCPGMLNCGSNGFCTACTNNTNNAANSCNSTSYGWTGGVCNTATGACYASNSISGAQCGSNADCMSGTCQNGGCTVTTSATDCSASFPVAGRLCATNADCNGDACQTATGTCLLSGAACTTDANCPGPSGATSQCNAGQCSCSSAADCSGGAACNSPGITTGTCASTVTLSLCQ